MSRSVRRRLVELAVVLGAAPWPALAACDGPEPVTPEVSVRVDEPPAPRIVAAPQAEIRQRTEAVGRGARGDAVTRGLTVDELRTEAGYTLATATLPDGRSCVALKGIQAKVGSGDVTVLIDRGYEPGSCQHRAVLDHEREHVRINADALGRTGRLLDERLRAVADDWAGRWVPDREADAIKEAVDDAVVDAVRLGRGEADARHARLDTPESYAEVQGRCDRW